MAADFRFIVVGRGMMGAAAARHLARQTDGIAVIGPDEPEDRASHTGVFGSHYDEGRITRTIDPDTDWARLANRSISRYAEIERDSGIQFYSAVGCLVTGPKRGGEVSYVDDVVEAAGRLGVQTELLDDAELKAKFPFFTFTSGSEGVFEPTGAGHISPRRLVKAQSLLAEKAGARVIKQTALSIRDEGGLAVVRTAEGETFSAEKILLATGGFSIAKNLLPRPVEMKVYGRTVTFFEVSEVEAEALSGMPSLISVAPEDVDSIYMLPPIRYPDGKYYIKIGGDPDDLQFESEAELRSWFRTPGRDKAREHLVRIFHQLVPTVARPPAFTNSCAVSYSPKGYPMIGYTSSSRVAILMGCNGTSAKSSDEIGRLGAELLLAGRIKDEGYSTDFSAHFRN